MSILGLTGFVAVVLNVFLSSIWIAYLFGWHIKKSHCLSNNYDDVNKEELYPASTKYSLRFSTKLKIFIIVISGLVIHLIEGIRISYLSIFGIDIRIEYGKYVCREVVSLFDKGVIGGVYALVNISDTIGIILAVLKQISSHTLISTLSQQTT
ncbi:hypothetical protein KSF78_0001854 [Schistosoma japonicum]|nr:hypothetical protein KSF78_0001854 [Schistosoma japonicum]